METNVINITDSTVDAMVNQKGITTKVLLRLNLFIKNLLKIY